MGPQLSSFFINSLKLQLLEDFVRKAKTRLGNSLYQALNTILKRLRTKIE